MIGEEYKTIINEEIDGEATPERSAKLTEYLDSHEEARMYHDDIMRLAHMLGANEPVDPPVELKTKVMKAVHARAEALDPRPEPRIIKAKEEGWLASLTKGFQSQGSFSYAYFFAAGVLVAVGAFAVMNGGLRTDGLDSGRLTGAMAPFESFVSVDKQTFDQAGIRGIAESKYASGEILTEIQVSSPGPVAIEILFDPQVLELTGFEQGSAGLTASIDPGRLILNHSGENRYSLVFDGKEATAGTVVIRLEAGEVLIEKALRVLP